MADKIFQSFEFTGRRVLITGGGRGMGKVAARMFTKLNATVFVIDKEAELLANLNKELPSVTTILADLTDWKALENIISPILPIHHLVNNAAILSYTTLLTLEEEQFDSYALEAIINLLLLEPRMCNINLKAVIRVGQIVARGMIEHKLEGATIVNMSSIASSIVAPTVLVYGATKAAVEYVTKSMALELAPYKIRVNSVQPACVKTEMIMLAPQEHRDLILGPMLNKQVYHQELMEPETVVRQILYLSSPMSEMMTGTAVAIDAGYRLH